MTMVVIREEDWMEMRNSLQEIKDIIAQRNGCDNADDWITSQEARKILGVSLKTWQNYRDSREISFSQRGRKIYVLRKDIDEFMKNHYIRSRNSNTPSNHIEEKHLLNAAKSRQSKKPSAGRS